MTPIFLKSTLRTINRDKFYSAINITGLALGLASAILILLYIKDELTFDTFYPSYDKIYRIGTKYSIKGESNKVAKSSFLLGKALKDEFPQIEEYTRVQWAGENIFRAATGTYREKEFYLADSSFFNVFQYKFIFGDKNNALKKPFSIVLSQKTAIKFFGELNPVGQEIFIANRSYTITGVIEDLPTNTHFFYRGLFSMSTISDLIELSNFWQFSPYTYIKLKEDADIEQIDNQFPLFYKKNMEEVGSKLNATYSPIFQRIDKIHLYSKLEWDMSIGHKEYIYIFGIIGIFILMIASINYMNLATAKSQRYAKEVGIFKVVGFTRKVLIFRYLVESISLAVISWIIALTIVEISLPWFNQVTDKQIAIGITISPFVLLSSIGLTFMIGLFAGSYPSFYLSSFIPLQVLTSKNSVSKSSGNVRRALVIIQFTISTIMIIGTIVVFEQFSFLQRKDLGFSSKNLLTATMRDTAILNNYEKIKSELLQIPEIKGIASAARRIPSERTGRNMIYFNANGKQSEMMINFLSVDKNYISVLNLNIIDSIFVNKTLQDSQTVFFLNQAVCRKLNCSPKEIIGKPIQFGVNVDSTTVPIKGIVNGVLMDFNYTSLHNRVDPIVIKVDNITYPVMYMKVETADIENLIISINSSLKKYNLSNNLDLNMLNDNIHSFYIKEKKLRTIFSYFSLVSIFLSCLGLLGLTAFVAEQRSKEIGVRKVLGASFGSIFLLLTMDFLKLILLSNIIAYPIVYIVIQNWLKNFAYSIEFNLVHFIFIAILAIFISILIALIIIGYLAIKAASANPLKSLRYE